MRACKINRRRRRGFTFVEILAAMLFMAIVIPVALKGMLLANRIGVVAQRKRIATQLADEMLSEKMATEEWRDGDDSGVFEDQPDYSWRLITTETWSEDAMRVVAVEVTYKVQGQDYTVQLSTLGDETDPLAATDDASTLTGSTL